VKILEVANTLIRMSGRRDIDIVFTGLRPGEKLGEELFSTHEERRETAHPLVDSVAVPSIDSQETRETAFSTGDEAVKWMAVESGAQAPVTLQARSA